MIRRIFRDLGEVNIRWFDDLRPMSGIRVLPVSHLPTDRRVPLRRVRDCLDMLRLARVRNIILARLRTLKR